jgi:2'-5' RNA ligase
MLLIEEPVSIGKGVAYKIESPELRHLHKSLQQKWQQDLSPQDRQKLWPHITIQNKVRATDAKDLLDTLKTSFYPFSTTATGLQLWEYLGGPWKLIEEFVFEKEEA